MLATEYSGNRHDIYINNSVPGTAQRLDTRDPLHYGVAHVDAIGSFLLAHAYADRQPHILDMLNVLATTGTGSRVLAELKALSEQGVRIAIGPRDDLEPNPSRVPLDGVATTADGRILWDCYYCRHSAPTAFDVPAYANLIGELAQIRNLAAATAWPGVPPLQREHVESAFMAELALRTAPAVAQSCYVPTFPATPHELDMAYMPQWSRGPMRFDGLNGLMPAWFTDAARENRDQVRTVLHKVHQTAIGQRLLSDLWVYARSRAVMLIHCSSSGKENLWRLDDRTPIWTFNKYALAGLAQSRDLTESEAQASGAFLNLLVAHGMLASKLGMLAKVSNAAEMQDQFEQQLIEGRTCRMTAAAPDGRPGGDFRSASSSRRGEAVFAAGSAQFGRPPASPPWASAARSSSQERPAVPSTPVPPVPRTPPVPPSWSPPPVPAGPPAAQYAGQETDPLKPFSRQNKGLARWLQNSARAFARTFNPSPSVSRELVGRHDKQNPYADSARRHSGT